MVWSSVKMLNQIPKNQLYKNLHKGWQNELHHYYISVSYGNSTQMGLLLEYVMPPQGDFFPSRKIFHLIIFNMLNFICIPSPGQRRIHIHSYETYAISMQSADFPSNQCTSQSSLVLCWSWKDHYILLHNHQVAVLDTQLLYLLQLLSCKLQQIP